MLRHLLTLYLTTDVQVGGLENRWIMDSGCSRHMTGNDKWFSSLTPMRSKEYIVFGDNRRGKEMMSSAPPSLKMRRKKLRRATLKLPRVLGPSCFRHELR